MRAARCSLPAWAACFSAWHAVCQPQHSCAGGVVLVILAAIDGGFSGDWSRLGIISKDQEATIRQLLGLLGLAHLGFATVAARSASEKGLPVLPNVAKVRRLPHAAGVCAAHYSLSLLQVLAVGFLAMVETLYKEPGDS